MTEQAQPIGAVPKIPAGRDRRPTLISDWRRQEAGSHYMQGALALTYSLPSGVQADPRSSALTLVHPAPEEAGEAPDAHTWAARFLQAVVEVVSSDRPLTQLVRWTDQRVYAEIARRQQRVAAHRRSTVVRTNRQQVATVHICHPAPTVAEVSARVSMGGRSRAVAARLVFSRDRWLCTAICFG
ncbi:MAG: hypothetical protein H0U28_06660 [Nocardioidaceae bacterium]|nr:hypothetical protein [Nocardioidaceae bacterium]